MKGKKRERVRQSRSGCLSLVFPIPVYALHGLHHVTLGIISSPQRHLSIIQSARDEFGSLYEFLSACSRLKASPSIPVSASLSRLPLAISHSHSHYSSPMPVLIIFPPARPPACSLARALVCLNVKRLGEKNNKPFPCSSSKGALWKSVAGSEEWR